MTYDLGLCPVNEGLVPREQKENRQLGMNEHICALPPFAHGTQRSGPGPFKWTTVQTQDPKPCQVSRCLVGRYMSMSIKTRVSTELERRLRLS